MRDELEAVRLAASAGADAIRGRTSVGNVRVKAHETDIVTDTDIAAGVAVVDAIRLLDSRARFVIEEPEVFELTGLQPAAVTDDEVWVVDPLDGTTSYVHGFPCYSVSVALLRAGRPVAGAVHNVPAGESFSAAEGIGAFLGQKRIACASARDLGAALLVTGFPYDRGALLERQLACLTAFLRLPVHGLRRDGSAAVDCTHVACGRADGFWEFGLKPWDMAAGVVIACEAGARVTGIDGEDWTPASTGIITATPGVHDAMVRTILEAAQSREA